MRGARRSIRERRPFAFVAALLAASFVATCGERAEPERWNVLLVTIDTLRADHVGAYGYPLATTPNLDRLAAESIRFAHASTPRAKTTPALCSLFTGLYPHEHGVRDLVAPLGKSVPVLQEALRRAGWRTGAVIGNWVLAEGRSGLERGFDAWIERLPEPLGVPPDDVPQRTAKSLTDAGLALLGLGPADPADGAREPLANAEGDPWFLWLHYMDPHGTYAPPDEHRVFTSPPEPIGPPAPDGRFKRRIAEYNVPREAVDATGTIDAAAVRDLYDGEVRYLDHELGRLFDALRERGALERTLVIVTADHGESLGEHEYWFEHGLYAYESTAHVPLLVRLPDAWPARPSAAVRRTPVSLVDLAPTLCELLSLPPLAAADPRSPRGVSRVRTLTADDTSERAVFYEKVERADVERTVQTKGVRIGKWKLLRRYTHRTRDGERELVALSDELYDLEADPLEAHDVSGAPPETAPLETLQAALEHFTAADREFALLDELLKRRRDELERTDPDAARRLKQLGYW
ncbi:MAG: sulfatase-like hydrolase/transferase [Planctomycetes bacterium]|nr:sulfatase-like hydrolase/transferase [Planctomycetota bacterium]